MAKAPDGRRLQALRGLPPWARPLAEAPLPVGLQRRMAGSAGVLVDTLALNDSPLDADAWRAAFAVADHRSEMRLAQRIPDAGCVEWLLGSRRRAKVLQEVVSRWHLSSEHVELLAATHPRIPVGVADHLLSASQTHPKVWPLFAEHMSPVMARRWVRCSGWVGSDLDARVRAARGDAAVAAEPIPAVPAAQFVALVGRAMGPSMGAITMDAMRDVVPAIALRPDTHELLFESSWWFLLGPLRMSPDLQERFAHRLCRWGPTTKFARLVLCAATFVDRFDTDPGLAQQVLDALGEEKSGELLAAGVLAPEVRAGLPDEVALDVELARSAFSEVLRGQQWVDLLVGHVDASRTLAPHQLQRVLGQLVQERNWIGCAQVAVAHRELSDAGVSFRDWGWDRARAFLTDALPSAVASETARIASARSSRSVQPEDRRVSPGALAPEALAVLAERFEGCPDEGAAWDVALGLLETFTGSASALADAAVAVAGIPAG